jgi:YD repeat-containing protein
VALTIVDANGRLVRRLVQERLASGAYEYRWDGRDDASGRVASGVYFARLAAGAERTNYKLILAR